MKFYKRGELDDAGIVAALQRAARDYENGALIEVRDVLAEIVDAIDEFTDEYERKENER